MIFLFYNVLILNNNNHMQVSLKEDFPNSKQPQPNIQHLHNYGFHSPRVNTEEGYLDENDDEQQKFSISLTARSEQPLARIIRRSMVNRSCINTCNYSCKNLTHTPSEIKDFTMGRLSGIQKIDLSYNSISLISSIAFEQLSSLKELIINDNQLVQIPHHSLNCCRQLRIINLTNNQLSLLPPLHHPTFILARGNPFRLITSQLVKLTQIEFATLDWLDYLLDNMTEMSNDRFKDYSKDFIEFKRLILDKVDYTKQDNSSYCDFHCLFTVKMQQWKTKREGIEGMFAVQAAKAILRGDSFFINYLRNFHNEVNYAGLTYNSHLLLQTALETGKQQALDLFKLRKNNYASVVDENVYFDSLRVCCKHSCYDIFKYLIHIRSRKRVLQTQSHLNILIKQVIQRYNKEKESDKILIELIRIWKQNAKGKVTIRLPIQFSYKIFKSISTAMLDIFQNQNLVQYFQFQSQKQTTTPLHFAMRSRNEELIKKLLQNQEDVFQKNYAGQSCKYVHGSTQISRKMVWIRQKKIIKQFWEQSQKQSSLQGAQKSVIQSARSKISIDSVNNLVQTRIGYSSMLPQFLLYRRPIQGKLKFKAQTFQIQQRFAKTFKDEEIFPHLKSSIKIFTQQSWIKNYLKKVTHSDVAMLLLQQIDFWKQGDFMLRLERWSKAYSQLEELFDLVKQQRDILLKYEIMQTMFRLTGLQSNISDKPLEGGNFWCCQNVVYQ